MDKILICETCITAFTPEETKGVRFLKVFNGYTVDLRLQEFRKAVIGEELEFIPFNSPEGIKLLKEMHTAHLN